MYRSSENCLYIQEKLFLEKLNESHESSLRRLSDNHREKIALMERQFLQQKQQVRYIKSCLVYSFCTNTTCRHMIISADLCFLIICVSVNLFF